MCTVSLLQPHEADEYARLCARTFLDNKAYAGIFNFTDSPTRLEDALHWFFTRRLSIAFDAQIPFFVGRDEQGTIVGGVGVVSPHCRPSPLLLVKHGLVLWPFLWGIPSFARLLFLDATTQERKDSWVLNMMAVAEDQQGKGIGTTILKEALAYIGSQADEQQQPYRVALNTQKEINLRFYGKQGFKLTQKITIENNLLGVQPFPSWSMELIVGDE
eukprot:m.156611 g.156611  ORF g.156611 m.156611 type:complete len:216 (+) comp16299_c1_seq1:235-882(+)